MTLRRWTVGTLGFLLLASAAVAREGIVRTRDGRSITGDVTETDAGVSINSRGVIINLTTDQIAGIEYPESVEQQFQERLSALAADDVKGRLDLARWAFEREEYVLARDAAQQALDIDPNSTDAVTMLNTIRVQMRLEQNRADAETEPANETADDTEMPADQTSTEESAPPTDRRIERRLLTLDDINLIRQAELRPTDTSVRVRFDNNVENRYISATSQEPGEFRNLRPIQKADRIINDDNPDYKEDVHILSDPQAMMDFRRTVQPLVLNGCATTGCHGGVNGGSLILFSPSDSDGTTYTNFYILDRYAVAGAESQQVFGKGEQQMIDRANPEKSLLLQYGLPADLSESDHPPVRGWRAIFRNKQDPRYQQVVNWIARGLKPVQPDYGIDYTPPVGNGPGEATETPPAETEPANSEPETTQPAPAEG